MKFQEEQHSKNVTDDVSKSGSLREKNSFDRLRFNLDQFINDLS